MNTEVKKLIKSIVAVFSIYGIYKFSFVLGIFFLTHSKYAVNGNNQELDFGASGDKNIILAGSSNVRYDFDFGHLNEWDSVRSYKSCVLSAPYGLYFNLKKIKQVAGKADIVYFDLPYTLYSKDQFLPMDRFTIGIMELEDYKNVFFFSPQIAGSYIFQQSIFSPDIWQYLGLVKWRYSQFKDKDNYEPLSKEFLTKMHPQNLGEWYENCSNVYSPEKHFIRDVDLSPSYLNNLRNYFKRNIRNEYHFLYPEVNKGNHKVSTNTQAQLQQYFSPVNDPQAAEYENKYMYDQNYHLNKCGAKINTDKLKEIILLSN